jgi:methanogenic corrinoid protein MtbC1
VLVGLGARWARQEISVLDEHVASERLMRGLVRVSTALPFTRTAPVALLVAGAGDDHTLGLSLVELCVRAAGWRTRWAGRRTPDADVVAVIERGEVDLVALSASATATDRRALARQLAVVGRACAARGVKLVIGGAGAWPARPTLARRFDDFAAFHRALAVPHRGRRR